MAIKIASCEDNPAIRETLSSFFDQMQQEEGLNISVDFFENGEQLLSKKKADYDIYVLDIHMGDDNLDGMTLAQSIRKYDERALIVFLTSLTRYLKEGYKVKAYRYLTKPVSYNEFKHEMCSAIKDIRKNESEYISLVGHSKYNKVILSDIFYIETDGRKSLIHTHNGDILCSYSISTLSHMLKEKNFYRCHNSYLINLEHVEHIDNRVVCVNGVEILVSRNKMKGLREKLAQTMGVFF